MSNTHPHNCSTAVYGRLLYFTDDPRQAGENACHYHEDGLLMTTNGLVVYAGPKEGAPDLPQGCIPQDYSGKLILPGFVDTHIHPPQHGIIASNSTELLHWLNTYTFPEEGRFHDPELCANAASLFFDECLKNGTTTTCSMATVHASSADALFAEAGMRNMRLITGKTLMDRNAPEFLTDTPEKAYDESLALIRRWHGKGRLSYAVTPRFAITSTPEQLEAAGALLTQADDLYLHTHLSENHQEMEAVKNLFPERKDYLEVYEHFGLSGKRSVFAHAIHLSDSEFDRLRDSGASISFCPSSNLFLGSGLFKAKTAYERAIPVGLGSDVGGGTSFSPFHTMAEGFKVCQLLRTPLSAMTAFYLATLGGAKSLCLDDKVGSFKKGMEADFVVIDPKATPLSAMRTDRCDSIEELLFVLMILGDDRFISATHIMGQNAYLI